MDKKPQHVKKEAEVAELQKLFNDSKAIILTNYRGLTVAQDVKLRTQMRQAGIDYRVAKNTLIKIACEQNGINDLSEYLNNPTAVAFAQDPVEVAKILSAFIKENKKTEIKAGLLGKTVINASQVDDLAKLPTREVLLAQVAGAMQAPMASFAGCAAAMLRQLVTVVDKVREQKEGAIA